jgi:hypothetical protein
VDVSLSPRTNLRQHEAHDLRMRLASSQPRLAGLRAFA